MCTRSFTASLVALVGLAAPPAAAQEPSAQARAARAVLQRHCHDCHGKDGSNVAGFGFVLDRTRLVAAGYVTPGKADESEVYRRLTNPDQPMPPLQYKGKAVTVRPTDDEKRAVRDWIAAGAPDFNAARPPRPFVTDAAVWEAIAADLRTLPDEDRPDARYFTVAHLVNGGLSDDELVTVRNGLAKLVNSLSWRNAIALPRPVGAEPVAYRIRLSDYAWTPAAWDAIAKANPYERPDATVKALEAIKLTRTPRPAVRADWFVAAASRPPLYHDVLGLPMSARDLETALLGRDAGRNVAESRVVRAGFNGSGVSENNRLIERHEIPRGRRWLEKNALWTEAAAYWKSYDFATNTDRQNLFQFPLGPGPAATEFKHDGGEVIFNLPNGLQAYLLVNDKDERIDEGPVKIVSNRLVDGIGITVLNGVSCMACHENGIIPKEDQIRRHVTTAKLAGFERAELVRVMSLYPERDAFQKLLAADAERFTRAMAKTGGQASRTEPVASVVRQFAKDVDARLAAAETGHPLDRFTAALAARTGDVQRIFGPLLTGGTVKRDVMAKHFRALAEAVGCP